MMKKTALVLLLAYLVSMLAAVNVFAEEKAEPVFDAEVEFLTALGVFEEDFEPYFPVTRSEFAGIMAKILYGDVDFSVATSEKSVFNDMDASHKNYHYVKALKELAVISGDGEGNFRPDENITVREAVAVVINALGYTVYANAAGGYPAGYELTAKKAGMLDGISVSDEASGYVLSRLVFNSLFADLVTVTSVSGGEVSVTTDSKKNILSERLGINEYDAIIVDDGIISLTGDGSVSDEEYVLAENVSDGRRTMLYTNGTDISSQLGKRVRIFSDENAENGRNEIINYSVHKRVTETVLNAEDVISVDISGISYEKADDESGKTYNLSFTQGGPVTIFNGVIRTGDFSSVIPQDGILTVVDNNGDNKYDFLNILSFNVNIRNGEVVSDSEARNIICGKTNGEDEYIGCKFNPVNGLHLEDADYKFVLNGEVKEISDLKENDVVSVAMSPEKRDGRYLYQLAVTRKAVSGIVESADKNSVTINGKEYKLSGGFTSVRKTFADSLKYDVSYKFLLDAAGKIAYSDSSVSSGKDYAYLIGIKHNKNAEELMVKLFTAEGEMKELKFAGSVAVDGKILKKAEDIISAVRRRESGSNPATIGAPSDIFEKQYKRPVIYTLNGKGEVTGIDTDNLNYPADGTMNYYASEGIIPYSASEAEDEAALKAGFRNPRIEELTRYTNSVSGRYYVSDETIVFCVPEIDVYGLDRFPDYASNKTDAGYNQKFKYDFIRLYENTPDDSNYSVTVGSGLSRYQAYDIQGYDIDPETGVAAIAVVRGSVLPYVYGRVPYDDTYPMAVYTGKTEYYDSESGRKLTKLYYTTTGEDEQYALVDTDETLYIYRYLINGCSASENPYNKKIEPLEKGDIIRIIKAGNELSHIERVFRAETIENALSSALYPSFPRVMYSDNLAGIVTMPCDERGYYAGYMSGYYVSVAYPASLKGNNLTALMGRKNLSDVDTSVPSSYTPQSVDVSGVSYILCQVKENGETTFKEGSAADIKTIEEYGKEKASILVYHDIYHQVKKIIIINRD